jgi:selenocysteine-specific elongation factor
MLSPKAVPVRVRGIQIRGKDAGRAQAGDRCALNLSAIEVADAARGDWVLDEAIHAPSRRMEVRFALLDTERSALAHWTPVHLHLATADVMAHVAIRGGGAISPGTRALVQLVIDAPIAALNGDRFILRDRSAGRTLGGGTVINPLADGRRRAASACLAALEHGTAEAAFADLLNIPELGVDCTHFETVFNLTAARAASIYQSCGAVILGRESRVAISHAGASAIRDSILSRLAEFHRAEPQSPGIDIAALRKELARWLSADAFSFLLRDMADAHKLQLHGSTARLPDHNATSNAADEKLWRIVLPILLQNRFTTPTVAELARNLGIDEAKLRDFLHRKSRTGEVMRIAEDLFYPKATLAVLAANAALVARSASKGLFSAAQYRDATGIGRTRVIKILEFLDTLGITQRIGDTRKMHKNFVPLLGAAKPALAAAPAAGKDGRARRKSHPPG